MVVSERFVWAHIPKTGGNATATMLAHVPRLIVMADHLQDHAKHLSLDLRRGSIEGKTLVANIRRLPAWALSYARHLERHGQWPDYEPVALHPPGVVAAAGTADGWLDEVVGGYTIDVWIRQEHLADDLVRFLRETAGLTDAEEESIRSVGLVNSPRPRIRRLPSPERFFTPDQIDTLYASNPRWAELERRVYG